MPQSVELVARLRAAGHPAVISGAGPTVLVLARGATESQAVLSGLPEGWRGAALAVDPTGAQLLS
jgi:homoserine kinase